jgi:hypothetical protein
VPSRLFKALFEGKDDLLYGRNQFREVDGNVYASQRDISYSVLKHRDLLEVDGWPKSCLTGIPRPGDKSANRDESTSNFGWSKPCNSPESCIATFCYRVDFAVEVLNYMPKVLNGFSAAHKEIEARVMFYARRNIQDLAKPVSGINNGVSIRQRPNRFVIEALAIWFASQAQQQSVEALRGNCHHLC